MKLKDLLKFINNARLTGDGNVEIGGIGYDSRQIKPGMLFVAVTGFRMDGNEFIPDAISRGAVAVMTEKEGDYGIPAVVVTGLRKAMADIAAGFYGFPGRKLVVAGVTGTNGKSTSVYLIQKMLADAGHKTGMVNSLVYDTGEERLKAERTTPESVDLQRMLFEMNRAGCTHGAVEVSSHALVLHRVENIDFKVGLFTSFSRDHLDFHKTMEEYLKAKKLFLNFLEGEDKYVVLNVDVKEFAALTEAARCNTIRYSTENRPADVFCRDVSLYPDRTVFTLVTSGGTRKVTFGLPGRYNLSNAVGSAAVGIALGVNHDNIVGGLTSAEAVPGRFEPVDLGQPFSVLIDYAHTPDAIERLCLSAREIAGGSMIILFGCGGDRDRGKRPLMGEAASRYCDFVVVTSDNPRTEDPLRIIEDIKPGLVNQDYLVVPDRREAIMEIMTRAEPGDMILVAGKGAEDYLEIGTKRYPFEDKREVINALGKLGYKKVKTG
jgi:UDP-N-acetylmuramoyl-L-alanyl-D-glutamate--2,6-diaminopimelate ligase